MFCLFVCRSCARLANVPTTKRLFTDAAKIPISIKSIREDGDIQFIDIDAEVGKPLLSALTSTTKIQSHCGGKGICGQCVVSIPQDVYNRLSPPNADEQTAIATNLSIPKNPRLACQLPVSTILRGRTVEIFIPFEFDVCVKQKKCNIILLLRVHTSSSFLCDIQGRFNTIRLNLFSCINVISHSIVIRRDHLSLIDQLIFSALPEVCRLHRTVPFRMQSLALCTMIHKNAMSLLMVDLHLFLFRVKHSFKETHFR